MDNPNRLYFPYIRKALKEEDHPRPVRLHLDPGHESHINEDEEEAVSHDIDGNLCGYCIDDVVRNTDWPPALPDNFGDLREIVKEFVIQNPEVWNDGSD